MSEFALLFRQPSYDYSSMPAHEMAALQTRWQDWIGSIAAQGKLAGNAIRLAADGKVLKPGGLITDGPFVEIKERLGSLLIIRADSIDEAITLAHGCPSLDAGGSVEVRPLYV